MSTADLPRGLIEAMYAEYAREYLRSLPPEHFMEATTQGRQREITLESLALLKARRRDVHVFNELLVQYEIRGQDRPGQVVPDNMLVVHRGPIETEGSYDVPIQPAGPFWVLEYVSRHSKRKDYNESLQKYERELKVPYCLMFYPEKGELRLLHRGPRKYRAVRPNDHGRLEVPDLDIEVALLDGWVRFWYKGKLLPLPGELQREVDQARRETTEERQRAERERRRAKKERQQAEEARQRAEQEKQRAEQEKQRADEAGRDAEEMRRRLEQEQQARQALERQLEVLRARATQQQRKP
jgi:Uma2 family endonuclease